MPINTSGYSAQKAPTSYSYSTVSTFLAKGLIFIYAGCRGRYEGTETSDSYYSGAPWGVTDLKAAIRFLRYNSASLPRNSPSYQYHIAARASPKQKHVSVHTTRR